MSQHFLFDEDYQWPTKIMRSVIWSGTMGFVWLAPFIALVITSFLYLDFMDSRAPRQDYDFGGIVIALYFAGVLTCATVSFFVGAAVGFFKGLKAEPEEPMWPFQSNFFRASFDWGAAIIFVAVFGASAAALVSLIPNSIF